MVTGQPHWTYSKQTALHLPTFPPCHLQRGPVSPDGSLEGKAVLMLVHAIHSFSQYLQSICYIAGTVLSTEAKQQTKISALLEPTF